MKNWNWKQWTGFALAAAFILIALIMHLVQPQLSYSWHELIYCGTFVLGFLTHFLLYSDHNKTDK